MAIDAQASCDRLDIAYTDNWYPIAYDDGEKERLGLAIAIQTEIFRRLNLPIRYIPKLPWRRQLAMLGEGEIDAMAAIYYNDETAEKFLYTSPYHMTEVSVFKRIKSDLHYSELKDLKNYRGVMASGSSYGTDFDNYSRNNLDIVRINGTEKIIQMLLKGRADYLILPKTLARYLLNKHGAVHAIALIGPPVARIPLHMVFSKKSECRTWVTKVNATIQKMREEGVLARIIAEQISYE